MCATIHLLLKNNAPISIYDVKQYIELFCNFPAFNPLCANDTEAGHTYRSRVSSVKPAAVSAT